MAQPKKRAPTMHEVARLAGVSQTTVSFVLNDKPGIVIAEETRDRILRVVEQLGYRPNVAAQALRTSKTHLIGLISDMIATTPFAGKIIEGAQNAAWADQKLLLLVNTGEEPEVEAAAVEMLLDRQVEGIIYATMYHHAVTVSEALRSIPCVLLDCFSEDRALPSVVPDEVMGGRAATTHLLEGGHRRIAFANNHDRIPASLGRLEGYRQALAASGVAFDADLVASASSDAGGGYRAALQLMQQTPPPSALFCFNDRMAMGAYDALRKLGLAIPDDVAVVGFDNEDPIAGNLYPPLTTMQLPHYEMGEWAVNYLIGHLDQAEPGRPLQHTLACPLVKRLSA